MATFTYTRDRPNPPNNPSSDVPDMKTNCNSIDDIIAVNHFSFGSSTNNDGKHQFVEMPNRVVIPPGLIAGEATLYTKSIAGQSQLFLTRDNSGLEIQMSSNGITPIAIVPTFTPAVATSFTFLTFLPGNAVLISGLANNVAAIQKVTFSFNITAIYSVQITRVATEISPPSNRSFHQVTALAAVPGSFTFTNLDANGSASSGFNVTWQLFGVL